MDTSSPQENQVVPYQKPDSADEEEEEMATTPRGRRGFPSRRRSPNLYRLVPVADDMSEVSESTNSPSPERPANMSTTYFTPGMNVYYNHSSSPEPPNPSSAPPAITDGKSKETPAAMPPETPAAYYMDTPRAYPQSHTPAAFVRASTPVVRTASEPPQPPPPSISPADVKTESPDIALMGAPTPRTNHTPQNNNATSPDAQQGSVQSGSSRRTTRGSLAAAAAAANTTTQDQTPPSSTPDPGAPIRASITTWIITKDKAWILPSPQLGVSLAQVVPADVDPPQWMKYTRAPIVWDGKTDAGGKSGKNLVLIGAAAAKVSVNGRLPASARGGSADADLSPTSPISTSSSLDGLHLLMDFKSDEKPTYSYALMTRFAILGSPYKSLSLGEIYTMIESKFPWFARDESKWRDSIRYNLSSNCWFVKTKRALHQPGVGNLWMVDEASPGGALSLLTDRADMNLPMQSFGTSSLTGPKRPRKGRGKGSAFAEEDDEGSGDEPGPSIISAVDGMDPALRSPSAARNGTLMLTFDSKAKVPLDKEAGQRGATAHASHNLIPRIVTRHIVMNAVDQAFANAPNGQQDVDPREHVVQAINSMPFSLSSEDSAAGGRRSGSLLGNAMTRAASKLERSRVNMVSPKQTPAPPWAGDGSPSNGVDEGIGSGRDDDESGEDEGDDYWLTENNGAEAGGMESHVRSSGHSSPWNGDDVQMAERSAPPSSHTVIRRPSTTLDTTGLQSLSEAALSSSQARPSHTHLDAQRSKSPDVLVLGRELSPRMINNVLTRRRQANVLDPDAFLRQNTRPAQPSAREEPTTGTVTPPSFAALFNSAQPGESSSGGGSRQSAVSSQQQQQQQQATSIQPGMFRPARQPHVDSTLGAQPIDHHHRRSSGSSTSSSSASAPAGRRPQLAKLAPAATSSASSILDSGRSISGASGLNLRIPGTRNTPPLMKRPLTPNRGDGGASSGSLPASPYAPPPDSRKRKHVPQSPDRPLTLLDSQRQKVRRVDERRRVNQINPMFSVSQAGPSSGLASASGHVMAPPPTIPFRPASGSSASGSIGFATPSTSKSFATPLASGSTSSAGASTSAEVPVPAFGQSGFMFKNSLFDRGLPGARGRQSNTGFTAFSSGELPSFRSQSTQRNGNRDPSRENMELDSDDDLPDGSPRRGGGRRRSSSRMDTDASDEEVGVERGEGSAPTREMGPYRGPQPPRTGIFARITLNREATSSAPPSTSSARAESSVPPTRENTQTVSPTSAARDSPVLAPISHATSRGAADSPRLPSINSLLRQSPTPDSLPPIQNRPTLSSAPSQLPQEGTTSAPSRVSPSSAELREVVPATLPEPTSAYTFYYGFFMTGRPRVGASTPATAKYNGGDDDDSSVVEYTATDWRD
ncbi:hypothetical protein M408DRAFT_23673 [Serendipita vermifera MAFF 305830]|uniref:Fork-head domain-containing protein n=1 Tax=Serendipita vermifera MAFF 305830 TaxID=933852 RepID=A0A0C3B979_SERVB|nr:hypothetical protein M408DRAFT_23673 [Serendipita vermifera MAFF 305830]